MKERLDFMKFSSAGILLYAGAYFWQVTFNPIPAENVRFADTILGFICGIGVGNVLGFWFVSSKGGRDMMEWLKGRTDKSDSEPKSDIDKDKKDS